MNATGMGPVYDGAVHFLPTPEDLVPALAIALLAGLRGTEYGRHALFALPAAWLLGMLTGLAFAVTSASPLWASFWFLVTGGLVAADAKLSRTAFTMLVAVLGLAHGYLNGTGMGLSLHAVVAAVGLVSAVFVLIAIVSGFVARLRAPWARIAVRVGGSWIAASGLLLLGWSFR